MEQGRTMNKGSGRNGSGEVQDRAAERSICLVSCRAPTSLDVNTREQCIALEYRVLSYTSIPNLIVPLPVLHFANCGRWTCLVPSNRYLSKQCG
jgi:hypothetical protein